MSRVARGYDRLAEVYESLEHLAFGSQLEAARRAHLADLGRCRKILVLGQGDGRFLLELVQAHPELEVSCYDLSAAMIRKSRQRLEGLRHANVKFHQQNILTTDLPENHYDAIVTHFFLDLFPLATLEWLILKLAQSLKPQSIWLYSDFQLPPLGLPYLRAKLWLELLYRFFALQTAIPARQLADPGPLIIRQGFRLEGLVVPRGGLVTSQLYYRGERRVSKRNAPASRRNKHDLS